MHEIKSLGIFVGTGQCNAYCTHCAGVVHRKYAPKEDGIINEELIYQTLKSCYNKGARSLSITSSGEPTLSPLAVTKSLDLVNTIKKENINYSWINLYSNGIRIGKDNEFCKEYLPLWKNYGLRTIYITVHDTNIKNNARIYNIKEYPPLEKIISRIHNENLLTRANLVLSKNNINTYKKFVAIIENLRKIGFDHISAWPIRNLDDKVDLELSPSEEELDKMDEWIKQNNSECKIRLLREKNRILYQTGQKLTLFQDGILSSSWCN